MNTLTAYRSVTDAVEAGNAQPLTFDVLSVDNADGTDTVLLLIGPASLRERHRMLSRYFGRPVDPENRYCGLPARNRHLYDA